eukprot:3053531-Rhodomonas_salina.3
MRGPQGGELRETTLTFWQLNSSTHAGSSILTPLPTFVTMSCFSIPQIPLTTDQLSQVCRDLCHLIPPSLPRPVFILHNNAVSISTLAVTAAAPPLAASSATVLQAQTSTVANIMKGEEARGQLMEMLYRGWTPIT